MGTDDPAEDDRRRATSLKAEVESGSLALAMAAIFLLGTLLFVVIFLRGRFEKIYADFGAALPALTAAVDSALFAWLVALLFGLTVIKEPLLLRRRTARAAWNTAAILAALVLGTLYVIGMWLPWFTLWDKLTG